jgi:hypothetical protein
MKKIILLLLAILPIFLVAQKKSTPITVCFGVGPVYCYYGHNTWIVTPGLLNDPAWDLTTMSVPERKIVRPAIVYFEYFQEKKYALVQKKSTSILPTYQFHYNPKMLTLVGNK